MSARPSSPLARVYTWIVGDAGEADVADDPRVPRAFLTQIAARTLTRTGDVLASPRHVLSLVLAGAGTPTALVGLLVPVREIGSLLPQLAVARLVDRVEQRRTVWVAGALLQALAVAGFAIAVGVAGLDGTGLGLAVLGLLVLFSLGRSAASVTSKDLLGRTVPARRRGRVSGIAASLSGWLAVAAGLGLGIGTAGTFPASKAALLLGGAALLWVLAGGLMWTLPERPAPVGARSRPLGDGFRSLRHDPAFRRFVIARALLSGTVLLLPYLVLLGRDASPGRDATLLGAFVIAGSLASALSGAVWGRLADHSSRTTLVAAGLSSAGTAFASLLIPWTPLSASGRTIAYVALFFLLALGHTGIRQGRKTYLVDLAGDEDRPTYTAVANVLIGVALVVVGAVGALLADRSPHHAIGALAGLGMVGALLARGLPEVEDADRSR